MSTITKPSDELLPTQLSESQREILTAYKNFMELHGRCPSIREVSKATERDVSNVHYHVKNLEKHGFMRRKKGHRAVVLLPKSMAGPATDPDEFSMKRFWLKRIEDESGVSGTGIVAEGIIFSNGKCALAWLTKWSSIGFYESLSDLEAIHGHNGKTEIVYSLTK